MSVKTELKLAYLKDTKNLIKNAIIEKGQDVSDSDTFRSYADKILAIAGGGESDTGVTINLDRLTVVLPITDITVPDGTDGMVPMMQPLGTEAGNIYLIVWNNVGYICEAQAVEYQGLPVIAVGNSVAWGGEDTGEPFAIGEFSAEVAAQTGGVYGGIIPLDGSTSFSAGGYFIAKATGGESSELVKYVIFMNGNTELYRMPVLNGDDCKNPIATNAISTPTKASTAQYNYTYSGWALSNGGSASTSALTNVTEDRTVYAAYTSTVRSYTITYYDGETLLKSETLAYGATPSYSPKKDGYSFTGWSPAVSKVTGNAEYHAQWKEFEGFAGMSWDEIAEVSESGEAANLFNFGDTKEVTATFVDGTAQTFTVQIVGFDHDDKADGTGKAGITLISSIYPEKRSMNTTDTNIGGWGATSMREWCNRDLFAAFPDTLQAVIKQVNKVSDGGYGDNTLKTTVDKVWIPSWNEFGGGVDFQDYNDKVLEPQGTKYTFVKTVYPNLSRSSSMNIDKGFVGSTTPYGYMAGSTAANFVLGFCI